MAPNVDKKYTSNPCFQKSAEKSEAKIAEAHDEIAQLEIKKESLWDAVKKYANQMSNYRREWGSNMSAEQKTMYKSAKDNYWNTVFAHTSTGNSIFSKFSSIRMYNEDLAFCNRMMQCEQNIQNIKNGSNLA